MIREATLSARETPINRAQSASAIINANRSSPIIGFNRESTIVGRENATTLEPIREVRGPLTTLTHTSVPQILIFLLAPNLKSSLQSFSSIKASIEYLNQFKDPAKLIQDEQAILALVDINDMYRKKSDQINTVFIQKIIFIFLKFILKYINILRSWKANYK